MFTKHMKAFSLIELMVVVALIGILVSLALPRFRVFVAKSRQAEAIHNLGVIDKLQKSYSLHYEMFGQSNVRYSDWLMGNGSTTNRCNTSNLQNKLGFRVEDCSKLRYDYQGGNNTDNANNTGGHQRIYPGCNGSNKDDRWSISRVTAGSSKLSHDYDIIERCN